MYEASRPIVNCKEFLYQEIGEIRHLIFAQGVNKCKVLREERKVTYWELGVDAALSDFELWSSC
jgi:hypothetical protein